MTTAEEWLRELDAAPAVDEESVVRAIQADALRHAAEIVVSRRNGMRINTSEAASKIRAEAQRLEAKP